MGAFADLPPVPLHAGSFQEDLVKPAGHNQILARFQHPDTDNNHIRISRNARGCPFLAAGGWVQFDTGGALAQFSHHVTRRDPDPVLVIPQQKMWDVISMRTAAVC